MTYQVLSIKWRPQYFEDVIGQQHVAMTLQNSIKQERLAHAYLFTGPRGVGKTTTARILAKYLNCKNPRDLNPCNECKNCKEITAGRSFDVLEIDGASNNGVENIRDLREAVKYPPSDGEYKIYIIDEVHMLSNSAFNALLKTLEEPPPHVKFIFATTEPEKVLPTIVSRTQRFDFKRIPLPKIRDLLREICDAEEIEISTAALTLIARKADGSMRDAESLLDQVISFSGQEIDDDSVAMILGIVDYDLYLRLSDILQQHDVQAVLDLLAEVIESGYDLGEFLNGLADFWRNLLILNSMDIGDGGLLDVPENFREQFASAAETYDERDLLRLLNLTLSVQQQFKNVRNQRIYLENFLLKLVHFDESVHLDELLKNAQSGGTNPRNVHPDSPGNTSSSSQSSTGKKPRRNIGRKKTRFRPGDTSQPRQSSPESNPTDQRESPEPRASQENAETQQPDLRTFQEKWQPFTEFVKEEKGLVGQFLNECEPVKMQGKVLEVLFDNAFAFHMKKVEEKSSELETLIQQFFQVQVRLKCRAGDTGRAEDNAADDIIDDPITQAIINNFDGEIIQ